MAVGFRKLSFSRPYRGLGTSYVTPSYRTTIKCRRILATWSFRRTGTSASALGITPAGDAVSWRPTCGKLPQSCSTSRQLQLQCRRQASSDAEHKGHAGPSAPVSFAKLQPYTAPQTGFISLLPTSWIPYAELMRLDKPTGLYLFYFPYLFGILYAACLTSPTTSPTSLLSTSALFLVGTVIMRGTACTWNDNIDRDLDRQVARCRLRPIARGAVSPTEGHIFAAAQSMVGLGLLSQLPIQCTYYAIPIIVLLGFYPFAKRVTNYPQVILGFPVAWAMYMASSSLGVNPLALLLSDCGGGSSLSPSVAPAMICFYAANFAWTVIYDTIYAHQDVEDDAKAGVKSIAVRHRYNKKAVLSGLAGVQLSLLVATGLLTGFSPVYFVGSCGGSAVALAVMIRSVDLKQPGSCAWWFRWGAWFVGGSVVSGLLGEYSSKIVGDGGHGGNEPRKEPGRNMESE